MEPEFCTQSAPEEMVEEYWDPMVEDQEAFGDSDEPSGIGPQHHGTTHCWRKQHPHNYYTYINDNLS
jgi:uncharacterized protein YigE (DUF2233 family)